MRVGVVGHGSIGKRHAQNLRTLGHNVQVYDPADRMDVRFERNIYETCDAVVVATPSQFHESGIRASVERGAHVLVEKPISIAVGALPQILKSAADKRVTVMVGNNLRFHPCVKQAKEWISQGSIGKPLWANFICAQSNKKYRESVILNWGAHEVDMAMYLLGPVRAVLSACERPLRPGTGNSDVNPMLLDHEDIADFVLEHMNGCRSSFHLDYITPTEIRESWIVGEDNNIGMEMLTRTVSLGKWTQGLGGSYDDDYVAEMKAFIDRADGKLSIDGATGDDGLATLKVLLDVRRKAGLR
jgi:predicted dehydrogenase